MATILQNGNIRFGDGTVQSTKTPTVISAFSNDTGYANANIVSAGYAARSQTIGSIGFDSGYSVTLIGRDINGATVFGGSFNCNCNC